ncbi:MAG: hypothetical protein KA403_00290, partial [Candidatus Omnitrophica bacterium]|nr:hypothetical protein [Candidatus Omnitrophota bacterium]
MSQLKKLTENFFWVFVSLLTSFLLVFPSSLAQAADIEAVTDSTDGSSGFSIRNSASVEQAHIDSIGNIAARGCIRIDSGLVECSETEGLVVDGNIGLGTVNPLGKLQVVGGLARFGLGGTVDFAAGTGDVYVQNDMEVDNNFFGNRVLVGSNVGIGTTSPQAALQLAGGDALIGTGTFNNSTGSSDLYVTGNFEVDGTLYGDGSGITGLAAAGGWNDSGVFVYNSTSTDRVGIGTNSPASLLSVGSASQFQVNVSGAVTATTGIASSGGYVQSGSTANTLTGTTTFSGATGIVATGNVGLGTTAPVAGLAVMNGNVGVGTWSPVSLLEVRGGTGSRFWTGAGTNTNANGAGELYVEGDLEVDGIIYGDGSGLTSLPSGVAAGGWTDGGTNIYTTLTTDTVGIGTTTPNAASFEIVRQGTTAPFKISSTGTGSGNFVVVTSAGNVGIGTSTPAGALAVLNGNVGIGTVSPISSLQVIGTVTATNFVGNGSGLTGLAAGATITDADNNTRVQAEESANEDYIRLDTAGTERMVINPSGNVGISTANPANLLAVGPTSQFQVNSTGAIAASTGIATSGGYTQSGTGANTLTGTTTFSNATTAAVFSTGNVGIGTTLTTVALLNVNGEVYAAGPVGIGTFTPTGMVDIRQDEVRIWTGAGTNTNATAAGELYVEGDLEVDGTLYGDGSGLTSLPSGVAAGGWTDGGTNVYNTTTSDNVGIGTTTPTSTLEIVKTAAGTAPLMVSSTATGDGNLLLITSDGNTGIGTTTPVGGLTVMNGNAGIGTWSPTAKLQVIGSILATSFVGDGSGITGLAAAGGWNDSGVFVYNSTSTDRVGIGTNSPASLLSVGSASQFQVNVSGAVTATTGIASSGGYVQSGSTANTLTGTTTFSGATGIVATGNVGLGTTAPVAGLAVMNGNVGVGTWSPVSLLEVRGGTGSRFWTGAGTNTNANGAGELYVEGDLEVDGIIYGDGSGLTSLPSGVAAGGWTDGGTNIYTTLTTDTVGIGTTTPNAASFEIVRQGTTAPFKISSTGTGSGNFVVVTSAGNVGIGTSTPAGALAVLNGNVGIGTVSPISSLQVIGTVTATNFVGNGSGLTGLAAGATITDADNNTRVQTEESANEDYIRLDTAGTERMVINPSGNVGISTANPANLFAVGPTSQFQVNNTGAIAASTGIATSGGYTQSGTDANTLTGTTTFSNATTAAVFSTGNVGIGTTSATVALLNVNGEVYAAGPVGIGTFTPTGMVDIRQDEVRIWTGAGTNTNATAAGELYVEGDLEVDGTLYGDGSGLTSLPSGVAAGGWTDGGTNVYNTATSDNVGIGTTTPTVKLQVVGTVN